MAIGWLTDDEGHLKWAGELLGRVVRLEIKNGCPSEVNALVVYANVGTGQRSRRLGLRWLEDRRRLEGCRVPALVYSFESRERLIEECSLLSKGLPGCHFERLPFIKDTLESLLPQMSERG